MHFVDVCGPPAVGKSTLCDKIWGPHDIPIDDTRSPAVWHDFLNEITRLFGVIHRHPSFTAAVRMNRRSVRKMAAVAAMEKHWPYPYIQTGFAQRGLGFGWRLVDMGKDINELYHFFRLMPVSIGVAMLHCDPEVVKQRNKDRESVPETAHENRSHMVDLMQPAIKLAEEVLNERKVPILKLDTNGSADECRTRLVEFANSPPYEGPATGFGGKVPSVSTPAWW